VTTSYLAKYAELPRVVARARVMLRPRGVLMMHEFTLPPTRSLLALWRLYFMLMRNTVARALPQWAEIYCGLPKLIERTHWLPELQGELVRNGFTDVNVQHLTLYGSAIVTALKG
jgi:demethylmenaquinone methyltransferase/2-methoxy-6-polyprenyl-1,4-benzoquinol methylase